MERLIKENIDTIFSYSLFITGNREKALDLMQDTILTVLNKKHLYKEEDHFRSWIFRILRNNYLNSIKKESVRNETSLNGIANDNGEVNLFFPDAGTMSPEDLNDPILKEKISRVIERMPLEYKDVIVLKEIEGFSYEETAQQLQIPIGTVMSRLHRARSYLMKNLTKEASELKIISDKKRKNG